MKNAGLDKAQAEIKIAWRNINNLRYADDTTLMAESKGPLEEMEEESEKVGLKLNIHKKKIMASGPITSWEIEGKTLEIVTEFIMWNAGLDKAQAGIKMARRNNNNLRYADDTTLMAESEELKSVLMKVKEESENLA